MPPREERPALSGGHAAAGRAAEPVHRKRGSPPHANNNLELRRPGRRRGTSSGGRISQARRAGSRGASPLPRPRQWARPPVSAWPLLPEPTLPTPGGGSTPEFRGWGVRQGGIRIPVIRLPPCASGTYFQKVAVYQVNSSIKTTHRSRSACVLWFLFPLLPGALLIGLFSCVLMCMCFSLMRNADSAGREIAGWEPIASADKAWSGASALASWGGRAVRLRDGDRSSHPGEPPLPILQPPWTRAGAGAGPGRRGPALSLQPAAPGAASPRQILAR